MKSLTPQIILNRAITTILLFVVLFSTNKIYAQMGIGIAKPAASSQLDVSSTTKGFLPPRMTQAERNAIASPAAGLMIWCKDCGVLGELQVFNGAIWTNMAGNYPSNPLPATVTIGTQVWMTRNLDVVTYRNGDTIPEVQDSIQWANLTTGAWCYYNNDPANGPIYGKLYNRAAVVDPRGLAPIGWHIPSDSYSTWNNSGTSEGADWYELCLYLGGNQGYGGDKQVADKMRATTLWNNSNNGVINQSGFTGLPGGQRDNVGSFNSIGINGNWWSTGTYSEGWGGTFTGFSWTRKYVSVKLSSNGFDIYNFILYNYYSQNIEGVINNDYPAGYGFSVRCVKD